MNGTESGFVPAAYTRTAILLHWLAAALIVAAFPLGLYMSELSLGPTKLRLYSYHKWIGIGVLLLAVVRVVWRARHRPPALPSDMPRWEQRAAHAMQRALYTLVVAVPLGGWLMSSATGFQVVWLGVIPLPDLVPRNKALGDILTTVHAAATWTLIALAALHAAAAVRHHWFAGDDVLVRMAPVFRRRRPAAATPPSRVSSA
jgi:cytochrome b561